MGNQFLLKLAKEIAKENFSLGICLGLDLAIVEAVKANHDTITERAFYLLLKWKQTKMNSESVETFTELCDALVEIGRVDLVNFVKSCELI